MAGSARDQRSVAPRILIALPLWTLVTSIALYRAQRSARPRAQRLEPHAD